MDLFYPSFLQKNCMWNFYGKRAYLTVSCTKKYVWQFLTKRKVFDSYLQKECSFDSFFTKNEVAHLTISYKIWECNFDSFLQKMRLHIWQFLTKMRVHIIWQFLTKKVHIIWHDASNPWFNERMSPSSHCPHILRLWHTKSERYSRGIRSLIRGEGGVINFMGCLIDCSGVWCGACWCCSRILEWGLKEWWKISGKIIVTSEKYIKNLNKKNLWNPKNWKIKNSKIPKIPQKSQI